MTENQFEHTLKVLAKNNFSQAKAALLELLAIPSIENYTENHNTDSEPDDTAPFGSEVAAALAKTAELAANLGLKTNLTPYYLTVDLGETDGSDAVGVLSHLDVVPFGSGWTHSPTGEVDGNKIYGRGSLDDKGPTVAALFALSALKESGFTLKHPIRMIIGGNEESGSRCIAKYAEENPAPMFGFSPDANFPIIFAEKGIAHFSAATEANTEKLLSVHAGTVVNAVPATAEAILHGITVSEIQAVPTIANSHLTVTEIDAETTKLSANGKAAHGSMPELGDNAIWHLLAALCTLPLGKAELEVCRTALTLFGRDFHGQGIGVSCQDEVSGELTLNFGTLHMEDGCWRLGLDMRYPVTAPFEEIWQTVSQNSVHNNLSLKIQEHKKPLYVPIDSNPAAKLLALYREYEPQAEPLAIGGGTYCRAFENFVAFGPLRPTTADLMHQADEYITEEDLRFLLEIYTLALWRLAGNSCQ